ncbi:hypothetical protein G6514_008770 [Epicoccum nigrum]|nr:hypothetical protein G6514_008770 [Epicoccum nigrum]
MASDESDNATHSVQEPPKEQQNNELARSAKRLYGFANSAAQALAAVPYLHTSTSDAQVMGDLVQKIYALVSVTSSFLENLMVESMTGGEDHKDMWSKDHHLRLLNSTEKCMDVFAAISRAVRIADEHFQVTGVGKGENYLDGFNLQKQQQAQIIIDECYGLVSQTNVIVKHTAFARIENLNTEEIQEALRLSQTLQKPEMHAIWTLKDEAYASRRLQAIMRPVQSTTAPPTGSLKTESASYRQSSAINIGHIKPMWAITGWPSTAGSLFAASAATPREADKQEDKLSSSTPTVVPGEIIAPSLPQAPASVKPGTVSFGQPSVIKPRDHMNPRRIEDDVSRSPFANWKLSNNPLSPVPHHLEAYIIQPMVKTCDVALTLSYAVLPLPLSERNMQTQIQKLGPDYSIMESLIDLHPQVLKLMQSQAVQRHGDLVSIHHGNPSSFTVSSGTLQTSPVIFMISTTPKTPPQSGPHTVPAWVQETLGQQPLGQQPLGQGSFANAKANPFGTETKPDLFQKAAPGPAFAPEVYSKFLEQRGEICTHVESIGTQIFEHYQTITANKDRLNKDCSLEEIRLSDYNAGRRFSSADTTNPLLRGLLSTNALPTITSASKHSTFSLGGSTPAARPDSLQSPAAFSAGGPLFASALSGTPASKAPYPSMWGSMATAQPASSQPVAAFSSKPVGEPLFASAIPSTKSASNPPTFSLGGTTSAAQAAASQPAAQPGSPFTSVGITKNATSAANPSLLPSGETAAASRPATSYSGPSSFGGNKALQDYQKALRDWEEAKKAELFGRSGIGQLDEAALSRIESQLRLAAGLSAQGAESSGAGEEDGAQGASKKD